MVRDTRPMEISYKGQSTTIDMPGWYCDQSEESIHTGEDMKVSDRMLNLLKARSEGLLEPEEIRRIRKKLHLSQEEAGLLIGGGPRAFQKYESGEHHEVNKPDQNIRSARAECQKAQEERKRQQQGVACGNSDLDILAEENVGDADRRNCQSNRRKR
jgi:putative zinc finger/helix-turn-helix YgiT family protein